ncbi:MAG: pentapeptide repeat-containing protein [Saprospiraceae bacterium]
MSRGRKISIKSILKFPNFFFVVATLIVGPLLYYLDSLQTQWDWSQVLVEGHGMFFDLIVFGILLTIYETRKKKWDRIEQYENEIDDFRPWKADEGVYRIVGNVKRLNKEGISKIDLHDCHLVDADLKNKDLREAALVDANLERANLEGAKLQHANLERAKLTGSRLSKAILDHANLSNAKMAEVQLMESELRHAIMFKAQMQKANMDQAQLEEANLRDANLIEANLRCANLSKAILSESKLKSAVLKEANLTKAQLISADLRKADLRDAIFFQADMADVELEGAKVDNRYWLENLSGAQVKHADLLKNRFYVDREVQTDEIGIIYFEIKIKQV